MNLILLEPEEAADARVVLRGRRAAHIAAVIKPAIGDTLRVGVANGLIGVAGVVSVSEREVALELGAMSAPPPLPPVSLVLAVPRPKVLARVIAAAASLGVEHIDLINAWRVEKAYFGSPVLAPETLRRAARRGCEQGGHPRVPEIAVHRRFMAWLETLADPPAEDELRLALHPRASDSLRHFWPLDRRRRVRACVGPEGGWIEAELRSLAGAGFAAVTIAATVASVETAVAVLLGQLELSRAE